MDYQNSHAAPDDNVASLSINGSANGVNSHTASDGERNGITHSEDSEVENLNGARDESPLSSGNRDDEEDIDMVNNDGESAPAHLGADGPQEATPPDSPPEAAANPSVPAHVVEEPGNDAMDEGDTLDDPGVAKDKGRDEREHEDITAEKSTEVVERSEQ